MALSSTSDWTTALYKVLYVEEKAGGLNPTGWVRLAQIDPADRDTIVQGYEAWKKTFALNTVPTNNLLNSPNTAVVSWDVPTGVSQTKVAH